MRFAVLVAVALAAGCATAPRGSALTDAREPELAQLARLLHDSAVDVQASLRMLAEVNNAAAQPHLSAKQKREAIIAATQTPAGMDRPVTLPQWVGPVEPVLQTIAQETGYQLEIIGEPPVPALPVVRIEGTMPAINALRDLGFQLQDRARIAVFERGRVMRLEYLR